MSMNVAIRKIIEENKCLPGDVFSFNSGTKTITYIPEELEEKNGDLALLHEIAHMQLGHFTYKYDIELMQMEEEAWDTTRKLAKENGIEVDEDHIKECLDSYDQWISKRATCPKCGEYALQKDNKTFGCFVCDCYWEVNDRKDRAVRKKIISKMQKTGKCVQTNLSENPKSLISGVLVVASSITSAVYLLISSSSFLS